MDEENSEKRPDAEVIESIREKIEQLRAYCIPSFPALDIKPGAKIIRMVDLWKSVLAYRLVDVASAALFLIKRQRLVPGNILARSVLETVSGVHMLNRRILAATSTEDFEAFVTFMWRAAFGSRDRSSNYEALSVLTMVNHLDKKYGVSREQYDHLSEYAHPNLKGGIMAYSDIDLKTLSAKCGINPGNLPLFGFGLGDLELILDLALNEYEAFSIEIQGFQKRVWQLPTGFFID